MTKRYDDPIDVTPDPAHDGAPMAFSWRGRRYEVDQWLVTWRDAGEWSRRNSNRTGARNGNGNDRSASNGVREREYFRFLARPSGAFASGDLDADGFMQHPGAVYDVYLDRVRKEWRLARVWD